MVGFKRTESWRRMFGREERKSLASLSESAESASQTTASVDSRTCLGEDLKVCCEKLMDETNLLHISLGVSPVFEITGGIINNGWGFSNRRDFMLDGEE